MKVTKIVVEGTVKAAKGSAVVYVIARSGDKTLLCKHSNYTFAELEQGKHLELVDKVYTEAMELANIATVVARNAEARTMEHLRKITDVDINVKFNTVAR